MWPGEQQGEGPNPLAGQPNPYLEPGYRQPNPYLAPPPPPPGKWDLPGGTTPGPGQTPGGSEPNSGPRTRLLAITTAAAVVVAAGVVAAVVLPGGGDEPSPAASPTSAAVSDSPTDDARSADGPKATVAGWKVVVNPDLGVAFDVPADWALKSSDWVSYVTDDADTSDTPLVAMKAPAVLKEKWCGSDDDKNGTLDYTSLASAGTRGDNGAKSTAEAARSDSANWVFGLYAQPDRKKVTTGPATDFTTASGLTGSVAVSASAGVARTHKCDENGAATTFAFKDRAGDLASWSFVGVTGVSGRVTTATVEKILATVRLYASPSDG